MYEFWLTAFVSVVFSYLLNLNICVFCLDSWLIIDLQTLLGASKIATSSSS